MSFDKFFWDVFKNYGSVDAYLGYMEQKDTNLSNDSNFKNDENL